MLGVFAEFARSMIVERVKAGLKRARAEGKVLGRPRVGADIEAKVIALRRKGESMRKIAGRSVSVTALFSASWLCERAIPCRTRCPCPM